MTEGDQSNDGTVPSLEEYEEWMVRKFSYTEDDINRGLLLSKKIQSERDKYRNAIKYILPDVCNSGFWIAVLSGLKDLNIEYLQRTGYGLLAHPKDDPTVLAKPWDSLLDKSYRINVLKNDQWPDPPGDDWVTPDSWLTTIKDVVRTMIVVRYLDCVEEVKEMLEAKASECGVRLDTDYEARSEGYYALHVTAWLGVDIPDSGWTTKTISLPVEIQVCTQIQEVIRALTHKFYESRRLRPVVAGPAWQWRFESDEFAPNYLGHILHYADGMIMNIRTKQDEGSDD